MVTRRTTRSRAAPIVRKNTVRLTGDVARHVRAGHPWVYREALGPRHLAPEPGTVIDLVDEEGEFVGRGLYDADSAIALRVFSRNPDVAIDAELVGLRVRAAVALRTKLLDASSLQCMRLVNGESDGLPGIVVERYGDYLVTQLYTSAIAGLRDALYDALVAELSPKAIYEQRRYRSLAGDAPRQAAAELVRGSAAPVEIEVAEGDVRFIVDVTAPLSTGLFADLREGRRAVRQWASGRRVLNLFSYTGAISVYAQAGGAAEVAAVDVAPKVHARARRNFAASGFDPEKPELIVGDVFKVLARFVERGRSFDMVVLDPPAFASAAARGGKPWSAVRDYSELIAAALDVLVQGGLLVAASSTHKMSSAEFELALAEGALAANTRLQIIDRRSLPPDFPTVPGFPEGNYLKFAVAVRG
ncbi:MAG: class I SAM-dependent rRNA methyltransferase [Deltaproteobacteria bacterium]|nr:class I SAM-dependent rRNA methyltransferase [Deltaproteobacteria bacterium]MCW5804190.1 class I SAM-dependent rRNA methyltransferase [Deltaproteobacteria bacterium]